MHLMKAGKSKIFRVGYQAGDPEGADVAVQVRRLSPGRSPSCLREVRLVLCRPSTAWMRPTTL